MPMMRILRDRFCDANQTARPPAGSQVFFFSGDAILSLVTLVWPEADSSESIAAEVAPGTGLRFGIESHEGCAGCATEAMLSEVMSVVLSNDLVFASSTTGCLWSGENEDPEGSGKKLLFELLALHFFRGYWFLFSAGLLP